MTLEFYNFQKLPKNKPDNYYLSSDCSAILESATDIKYIIWICSLKFNFIMIYMDNGGEVILSLFSRRIQGQLLFGCRSVLQDSTYFFQVIHQINVTFNNTLTHNINSILDIAVCDTVDIFKCLSNVGVIDVLCNIICSYLSFTVPMHNFHSIIRDCEIVYEIFTK